MSLPVRALFNKTAEECRFVGALGGRASAISRRLRLATWPAALPFHEPEFDAETAHEASAVLDEQFPHLRSAFASPRRGMVGGRGGRQPRSDNRFVILDGETMILADAARTLGVSLIALHYRLVNRTGKNDYGCVDVRLVGADRAKARRGAFHAPRQPRASEPDRAEQARRAVEWRSRAWRSRP